jgi:hypothetical protein
LFSPLTPAVDIGADGLPQGGGFGPLPLPEIPGLLIPVGLAPLYKEKYERIHAFFGTVSHDRDINCLELTEGKAKTPSDYYSVKLDFGYEDHCAPGAAMKLWDVKLGLAYPQSGYKEGDRVELKVSTQLAGAWKMNGVGTLHIEARERLAHYAYAQCWPAPQVSCESDKSKTYPTPQKVPPNPGSPEIPSNPEGLHLCVYDETCSLSGPDNLKVGCNANGMHANCRYCGFNVNEDCPKELHDCSRGDPLHWPPAQQAWCCWKYSVGCLFQCRESEYWSWAKRQWCCTNRGIGCTSQVDRRLAAQRRLAEAPPGAEEAGKSAIVAANVSGETAPRLPALLPAAGVPRAAGSDGHPGLLFT